MTLPLRVALLLALLAAPAAAEPVASASAVAADRRFSGQVLLGTGYRGIFPFDDEYCGEDDASKSYCLGRRPIALDLAVGVRVARGFEAIVTLSFGLESDFGAAPGQGGPHAIAVAPGVRLHLSDVGRGFFWSTLEMPSDLTGYDQASGADLGVRNRNAYELPLSPKVAALAFFGETASWRRWFRFELEAGLGMVVRL